MASSDAFKTHKDKVYVASYGVDIYLPGEYFTMGYRGTQYFEEFGKEVRYFGVGLMRIFNNEAQLNKPHSVKLSPLAIPVLLASIPTSFKVVELNIVADAPLQKWLVISFRKDDVFLNTLTAIKSLACMNMLISRLEGGKLDFLEPEVVVQLFRDSEKLNGVKLKVPTEELEMYIGERYQDPNRPSRKYRYTTETDPNKMISNNMREDAQHSTTWQGITHEDMSNSLIAGANSKNAGVTHEPTTMEKVVRGLPLDAEKASSMSKK